MKQKFSFDLGKYAALLGSVVLAGTKVADAQVVYTDILDENVFDTSYDIDFNNDLTSDIRLSQSYSYFYYNSTLYTYNTARVTGLGNGAQTMGTNSWYAAALSASNNIDSTASYWNSYSGTLANKYRGYFGGAGDKYIGTRFQISGKYHYGWVLVNVGGQGSSLVVKSYAYESTPGKKIRAGAISSPTVAINGAPASRNNLDAFSVTFQFSEDVTGFTANDIKLTNGTASNVQMVNASTYTADITPLDNGTLTINVGIGAVEASGNLQENDAASEVYVVVDLPPQVSIVAPSGVNSASAFSVTIQFNEDVVDFAIGDISLTNATSSNFQTLNDSTYTVDLTPIASGSITVNVNAGVADDSFGNPNLAADEVTVFYDAIAPSVSINGAPSIVNSTTPFAVTFQFNEDVTGFDLSDISLTNASAGGFVVVNDSTYTANITPTGNGNITINVAADVAEDLGTNGNTIANEVTVLYDAAAPTLVIGNTPAAINNLNPITVSFQFNEDVSGFDINDIVVTNATKGNFISTNDSTYTAQITPTGAGNVVISVAANAAMDVANNPNTAVQKTIIYDATAPMVRFTETPSFVNSLAPFTAKIQFNENVTGFTPADISVSNAAFGNFAMINDSTYTISITPNGDGDIVVDVFASAATDIAGNTNEAAQAVIEYHPASVQNISKLNIQLFPNPSSGLVKVEGVEVNKFSIYSLTGTLMMTGTSNELDITNLAKGTYLAVVETSNGTASSKIVKE